MTRRIAVRVAVSVVVVVTGVTTVALGSTLIGSADPDVPTLQPPKLSTGNGPISVQGGMEPGQRRSSQFSITNPNAQDADLWLSGGLTGGSNELYNMLFATIRSTTSGESWSGPLWQLASAKNAGLWDALETQDLVLEIEVAAWAGDAYEGLRSEFGLDFSFLNDGEGDAEAPFSKILTVKPPKGARARKKGKWLIKGTATDDVSEIAEVKLALIRIVKRTGKRRQSCTNWVPKRKKLIPTDRNCNNAWFSAVGSAKWTYLLPLKQLPTGSYILISRAIDTAGNVETASSKKRGNRATFKFIKITQ